MFFVFRDSRSVPFIFDYNNNKNDNNSKNGENSFDNEDNYKTIL